VEWDKHPGVRLQGDIQNTAARADAVNAVRPETAEAPEGPMVWAGCDDRWFSVAVKVEEPEFSPGWSGELTPEAIKDVLAGTSIQIALGFGERSADSWHGVDDPWYWKGMIRDTDFLFCIAAAAPDHAALLCLHKPGMVWGESMLRGAAEVREAKVAVKRSGTTTFYEVSLPRESVPGFVPGLREFRLGFVVKSGGQTYQLAECCAVPRHLASGGSFLPVEDERLRPNQIWWGIAR
jgi:hypothetical protein